MIAYKMYQLPSRLPAHHAARQINTSAASLHWLGLGEGPAPSAMGRAPRQRQEDLPHKFFTANETGNLSLSREIFDVSVRVWENAKGAPKKLVKASLPH